ncbi:RWD domain-containing protein 2A-like [Saccostrea echinata]|uniref:RWD domain-containing protein 2A-like n=1 Tax=Saccostrea echinata TaxID=191078 RepID=UPI002A80179C|nr:RWD domain-containing protein 2A-like [Saccostrea echinata]
MHRTGCPPVNADHLYTFKQHMDNFPHPCPTVANSIAGGTFPTPSPPQPISQNLHGWADVNPQNQASVQAIFNHFSQEDQQHAYNHFFQKLHRAPKVLEFSRFLLIYEGNDLTDTSHKTLGQLYLENEEFRETLNRHLRSIGLLEQMLSSKDVMIQVLGQSSTANIRKINDLQTQKLNLQRILCKVQQDKAQLQLDHNSLQQEHTQCLTELEDERKDKQVSQHRCQQLQTDNQALQNEITRQTETITDMQTKKGQLSSFVFMQMSLEMDGFQPGCDVEAMLELQMSEVEMLTSMFPNKSEFSLDDPTAPQNIKSFLSGQIKYEYLHQRLGFSLRVHPEGTQLSVELVCTFPHEYPQAAPNVFTRCPSMSKENHRKLNEDMHEFIQNLDRGEICMYSVIEWIQDNIDNYVQSSQESDSTPDKEVQYDTVLSRLWIYSHHIFSKFKRRDILDWAEELKLTGFSLPGKPGVICAEGYSRNVEDYWHRLRGMNWKRIVIREKEEEDIGEDDIDKHRKFSKFEEKVFGVRGGKGREYHMDFGQLHSYLEEHQSGHIFSIYFGVDGKNNL